MVEYSFSRGRSTTGNILMLEANIYAMATYDLIIWFQIFFDNEKAYDKTWCYGILKDLLDFRGNFPIFIKNFLKLRHFQVCIGSTLSDYFLFSRRHASGQCFERCTLLTRDKRYSESVTLHCS